MNEQAKWCHRAAFGIVGDDTTLMKKNEVFSVQLSMYATAAGPKGERDENITLGRSFKSDRDTDQYKRWLHLNTVGNVSYVVGRHTMSPMRARRTCSTAKPPS